MLYMIFAENSRILHDNCPKNIFSVFFVGERGSGGSTYGRTGRPSPIDQNLGLVMAARLRHGGKFLLKSLTFGHFLYKNVRKAFSFRGRSPLTPTGALPLDLAGGSAPRPPFRLALRSLAMVRPPWQILDPPLQLIGL